MLPIKFGLIGPNGSPMSWASVSGADVRDDLIVFNDAKATVTFTGVPNKPVPSLLRGFSAPVKLTTNASEADQLFLARHDSDPFNRWQSLQDVSLKLVLDAVAGTPLARRAGRGARRSARGDAQLQGARPRLQGAGPEPPQRADHRRAPSATMSIPTASTRCAAELIKALVARHRADAGEGLPDQ